MIALCVELIALNTAYSISSFLTSRLLLQAHFAATLGLTERPHHRACGTITVDAHNNDGLQFTIRNLGEEKEEQVILYIGPYAIHWPAEDSEAGIQNAAEIQKAVQADLRMALET